jgi:hypothetical protein
MDNVTRSLLSALLVLSLAGEGFMVGWWACEIHIAKWMIKHIKDPETIKSLKAEKLIW